MAEKQKILRRFWVPDDIEKGILSRLPVKSLLRFKCVNKSWRDTIEGPTFIIMHLNYFGKKDDNLLLHNFFSHKYLNQNYKKNKIVSSTEPLMSTTRMFGKSQPFFVVDSCNGLVCLSNNLFCLNQDRMLKIYFWNPSTRKSMELPRCHGGDTYFVLGFGFCSKLNDYKVVRIISSHRDKSPSKAQVYSLSKNSWKTIRIVNSGWVLLGKVQQYGFNNGASHWLGQEKKSKRLFVMSFKFDEEVFQEIGLPNHPDFKKRIVVCNVLITEYRDSLALVINQVKANMSVFHIWVMKEYGVVESWVKKPTIQVPILQDQPRLEPIWYNIKTKKIEEEHDQLLKVYGQIIRCKESLVSLLNKSSTKLRSLE